MSDIPIGPPVLEREQTGISNCKWCTKPVESSWQLECRECYSNPANKRECRVCKRLNISKIKPDWQEICTKCIKDSDQRECTVCKLKTISVHAPKWNRICSDCFKNGTWTNCDTCKARKVKPGSKYTVCGSCWHQSVAIAVK